MGYDLWEHHFVFYFSSHFNMCDVFVTPLTTIPFVQLGWTALMYAAHGGHLDWVRALCDTDARIGHLEAKNKVSYTLIFVNKAEANQEILIVSNGITIRVTYVV